MYDGSIVFNTKIDDSDYNKAINSFGKGLTGVSSKVIDLQNKISKTEREVVSLTAELEKMADTPVKSDATEKLEKDIEKAKSELRSLYEEADRIGDAIQSDLTSMGFGTEYLDDMLSQNKDWAKVQKQIDATESKLESYERELKQVKATETELTGKDTEEYAKKQQKLEDLTGQLNVYKAKLSEVEAIESDSTKMIDNSTESVSESSEEMANSIINSSDLITMGIKAVIAIFQKLSDVGKSVANGIWTATTKIAQGIGYVTEEVGKFTLKQFIGDWEDQGSGLGQLLAMAASIFSIYKIFDLGQEATELSSDLAEVQNVVDVTFTTMSEKVNEWAENAAESYGLSETMAKKYVGLFGSMAEAFGFTENQAYDMSTTLTGLAGDVASFYNITQDEAYTKLKSVFSGETETLKSLGIVMTEAALNNYALSKGLSKTVSEMTEAEKVALRYDFILSQLSNAQGDFVRTQDSWANQVRILQLRWQSLLATIGRGLINTFTPVLKLLNVVLVKLQSMADWFETLITAIFGDSSGSTGAITEDLVTADDAASDLADSISDVSTEVKNNLANFDELNVMSDTITPTDTTDISVIVDDIIGKTGVITDVVEDAKEDIEKSLRSINFAKLISGAVKSGNWRTVGFLIGDYITKSLKNINWKDIKKQAKKIAGNIASFINGAIEGIKWSDVGRTIAEGLNTAITFLCTLLERIDWNLFGKSLAIGLNSLIETFNAQEYGKLAAEKINAIFEFLSGFAFSFNWENLGAQIGTTLYSYFSNLNLTEKTSGGKSIPQTIAKIINGIVEAGIELFTYKDPETGRNVWEIVGEQLGIGFQEFLETFDMTKAIKMVKDGIGAFIKLIYNAFKNIDFKQLGKDTAEGLNGWLSDFEWWYETGSMINEIANDILDFILSVVAGINVDDLTIAIWSLIGSIDFEGIFNKLAGTLSLLLLKSISAVLKGTFLGGIWDSYISNCLKQNGYSEDVINNILGETNTFNTDDIVGTLSKKYGKKMADDTTNSYNKELKNNSSQFNMATVGIMQSSLEGASNTINGDKTVANAFSNLGETSVEQFRTKLSYDNTSDIAEVSISGVSDTVNSDSTIQSAFATKGAEGQSALTGNFNKAQITSHFSGVWNGIQNVFGSVDSWFTDTFGGAWKSVKGIFTDQDGISNIRESVENVFKGVLNSLIDGLNMALSMPMDALNSVLNNLRDFTIPVINQKVFSWIPQIPTFQIPKLATGTYVPANYGEFLAVLGDNKREPEVVSPLSTMKQALSEVLAESNISGNSGDIYITLTMPDGSVLFNTVVKENDKYKKSHGKSALR